MSIVTAFIYIIIPPSLLRADLFSECFYIYDRSYCSSCWAFYLRDFTQYVAYAAIPSFLGVAIAPKLKPVVISGLVGIPFMVVSFLSSIKWFALPHYLSSGEPLSSYGSGTSCFNISLLHFIVFALPPLYWTFLVTRSILLKIKNSF